jgi:hypothetical protein
MQSWEIRFLAIEPPKVRRCADETRAIASACPAARVYKSITSTSAPTCS